MTLARNEHDIDRIFRVVLAVVIFAAGYAYGSWLGLIGFVPLLTGLAGWCPLYRIFGFSTYSAETSDNL